MLNILPLVKTSLPCQGTKILIFRGALNKIRKDGSPCRFLRKGLPGRFTGSTVRPFRFFFSAFLLVALLFLPGAARGEKIIFDKNGVSSDTSISPGATNSAGGHQYGLSEPDKVWGSWPIDNNNVGYPTDSLFPWSSGSYNTVTVDGVPIAHATGNSGNTGYVIGGLWQGLATRNVVWVRNRADVGKIIGGAALGTASWNEVHLTGLGTKATQVTGGLSVTQETGHSASYNRVFITDAEVNGIVAGGWNASGTPQEDDTGSVPGGTPSRDNDVFVNSVRVDGSARINNNIYGGYNEGNSETYGNTVVIDGGTIKPSLQIAGGYSSVTGTDKTKVHGNTVTITGGDISWSGTSAYRGVYGGRSQGGDADVSGNAVFIKGGSIHGDGVVSGGAGGKSGSGASRVFSNTVLVSGGNITARVAGARIADGGAAYGNTVTLTDNASVTGDIYGAYDSSSGGNSAASIRNNTVFLYGGKAAGFVYGGHAETGESRANAVLVAGGTVTGDIYGGYSEEATASGNSVSLYGGSINSDVYGGGSDSGTAEGNRVDLRGATVTGSLYGGKTTAVTTARNNAVNLYGGAVTESVYGNWATDPDAGQYADWKDNGNTLNAVSGLTNVGGVNRFGEARIFGGAQLNVTGVPNASGGLTRKTVFGNLRNEGLLSFYNGIHNNAAINGDAARFEGAYSGDGAIGLEISFDKGGSPTVSDRVVFSKTPASRITFHFKALPDSIASGYAGNRPTSEFAYMEDGGRLDFTTLEHGYGVYAYVFEQRGNSLFAALTDAHVGEIGKSYSDGSAAGLAQVSAISESFLRDNLENAVLSTRGGGWGIAMNTGYSKQRLHAGNDIDLEGFSALVTVSYHREGTPFAVGVFGDMFQGSFRTRNGFSLPTGDFGVTSKGDLESYGGGISFQYRERLDEAVATGAFAAWTPGAYVKALARAGYSKMDFETDTLHPSSFEVGGLYYGATLGGGHVFTPAPRFAVDLYGYGAWTALAERDATDSLGQHIDFDRVDSLRLISGFRAAYKAAESILPYAGLGMEWESLGRPGAHVDGYRTDTADLSGLSGLIELGVNSRVDDNFFLDFRASGSLGERRGIGGMMEIRHAF